MKIFKIIVLTAILVFVVSSSLATLWDRGGGLIYDDINDITWLQDMNYVKTSGYLDSQDYNHNDTGALTWKQAKAWADALEYGGSSDWRLPSSTYEGESSPSTGFVTSGEMGYLYYNYLVDKKKFSFRDGEGNVKYFINTQPGRYWTGDRGSNSRSRYTFNMETGGVDDIQRKAVGYMVAVADGDVTETASSVLLLESGDSLLLESGLELELNN